jgi:acyl-CoA synthetase (AMP-forming)/AMP-acid ligase II
MLVPSASDGADGRYHHRDRCVQAVPAFAGSIQIHDALSNALPVEAASSKGGIDMVVRSPLPDIEIPHITVTQLVLQHTERLASKPALIDGETGRVLTYGQFATLTRRCAVGLAGRGFGPGDVIALYSVNLPEYAVALHGALAAGCTVTTINPLAVPHELATQLKDSGARYLIASPQVLANAVQGAELSGVVEEVFVFGEGDGARPFDVLLTDDGPWPEVAIDVREHIALLPYSSGTTGLPKGVMLTHYNLVADRYLAEGFELIDPQDTAIAFLPFFHMYGLYLFLISGLSMGLTSVTMPRFDLAHYLQLLQEHRSRTAYVVPPVVIALAHHPLVEQYDLSELKTLLTAAAPASAELCAAVQARLGCSVTQAYGMTELSPASHTNPPGAFRIGAGGVPLRNTESKVVSIETGVELGPHERGEVWVRGPQVMKGYLNRPDATEATITPDGWLKTGDIGYYDEDGYFYFVDRLKELIKYNAYQVAPAELEAVLLQHPAVADAAVIGVADEDAGEIPKAYVVPRGEVTAEALMAFVAERVAPYKKIRQVEFTDQIPKSASGKILRRVLIERERGAAVV